MGDFTDRWDDEDVASKWIPIDAEHLPTYRCEVWDGANVVNVYGPLTLERCRLQGYTKMRRI